MQGRYVLRAALAVKEQGKVADPRHQSGDAHGKYMNTTYKISDLFLRPGYTDEDLRIAAAERAGIQPGQIEKLEIARMAVDARKKHRVHYVISVLCELKSDAHPNDKAHAYSSQEYVFPYSGLKAKKSPVIVGSGPAGMFCALQLARAGLSPIVLERGASVEQRVEDVNVFFRKALLNARSNVQFGEGGAGTFSDGKLQTGTKDMRQQYVLQSYVRAGAPEDILYLAKPHLGTDKLRSVVRSLREELLQLGGRILFGTCLQRIQIRDGRVHSVLVKGNSSVWEISTDQLILAPGNAARDTFEMLHLSGIDLETKNFAVGVRIENLQKRIDLAQYGSHADFRHLPASSYKLVHHSTEERSVYSFCVCPGGRVVCGSSSPEEVVTNGMSDHSRDGDNINGAMVVGVTPADFGASGPLAGIEFQRRLERSAFAAGGSNFFAPVQLVGDFLEGRESTAFGAVQPTYLPGTVFHDLRQLLPEYITQALCEALREFDRRIHGFSTEDAILTAVETRTSSPVRIPRDSLYQTNVRGVFACGEGSGYAGGIMSSAVDGIKCAEKVCEDLG